MSYSFEEIDKLRATAHALTMQARKIDDVRAQWSVDLAEAFLAITTPDPRLKVMYPSIMTSSGRYFDYLHPETFNWWQIDDIAQALAFQNRFGGHTRRPYSIAQHLVIASHNVEPEFAFEALTHDAHEFACLDVMTPLKILMPQYRDIEDRAEAAKNRAYGLPLKMSPQVKAIDLRMLATEKRDLMHSEEGNWGILEGVEPLPETIPLIDAWGAKQAYIDRFWELAPSGKTKADCKDRFDNIINFKGFSQ